MEEDSLGWNTLDNHREEDKDGQGVAEEGDNHHKMQEEDILHRTAAVAEQMGILLVVEGKDNLVLK